MIEHFGVTGVPRLGATIFSFTREFLSGEWSLAQCLSAVGSLGGHQHVEILDSQHLPGYPILRPLAEQSVRDAIDASGCSPSLYGHEVELGWVSGRPFTDDKIVEIVVAAMEIAARLGFPMFRANMPRPDLLERLLPHADRLDLSLVVELHSQTIESPETQALVEAFEAWDSPRVGFLQDLGAFTTQLPPAFLAYKANNGVPDGILATIAEGYRDGSPKTEVVAEVRALSGDALAIETTNESFAMFGRDNPAALAGIGRHLRHIHTKFYEIVDGEEACIPYREIFAQLKQGGFTGVLSSEWTGFNFIESPIALSQLKAHHAMVKRLWQAQD